MIEKSYNFHTVIQFLIVKFFSHPCVISTISREMTLTFASFSQKMGKCEIKFMLNLGNYWSWPINTYDVLMSWWVNSWYPSRKFFFSVALASFTASPSFFPRPDFGSSSSSFLVLNKVLKFKVNSINRMRACMGEKAILVSMFFNIGSWVWYPLDFGVLKAEIVKKDTVTQF